MERQTALVATSVNAGVRTIALDDPERRNALSIELLDDLLRALEEARGDDATRCVVVSSTHPTVFCAGGNLAAFGDEAPVIEKHLANDRFPRVFRLLAELGKPTVCAAGGHTLAGGLGLALACDLIVAREAATFGTPEINVGVFPFMLMALLYRNLPRKQVDQLMLLGERVSAQRAYEIGFVNRVVSEGEDFDAAVEHWARQLAAKSPLLMRLGKDAIRRQRDMPFDDALAFLQAQLSLTLATEDAKEGVRAFREKREPVWAGR
jgi:enoyl-CoA hydratase/carnithine racemase